MSEEAGIEPRTVRRSIHSAISHPLVRESLKRGTFLARSAEGKRGEGVAGVRIRLGSQWLSFNTKSTVGRSRKFHIDAGCGIIKYGGWRSKCG